MSDEDNSEGGDWTEEEEEIAEWLQEAPGIGRGKAAAVIGLLRTEGPPAALSPDRSPAVDEALDHLAEARDYLARDGDVDPQHADKFIRRAMDDLGGTYDRG